MGGMKHPVSEILKTRRQELNLSQFEVAQAAGLRENDVSRWERGTVKSLPLLGVYRMCLALDLDIRDIAQAADESDKAMEGKP